MHHAQFLLKTEDTWHNYACDLMYDLMFHQLQQKQILTIEAAFVQVHDMSSHRAMCCLLVAIVENTSSKVSTLPMVPYVDACHCCAYVVCGQWKS